MKTPRLGRARSKGALALSLAGLLSCAGLIATAGPSQASTRAARLGSTLHPSAGASCAPSKGKVDLTFWSWEGGVGPVVAEFNKTHPDIHVTVDTITTGNYQSMFNALKAGKAPDLAMIEYDELPNFRLEGGLENIADCAPVRDIRSQFPAWTISQVSVGSNAIYAVPQDIEPMAMFYRKDLFSKYHLPVPTTWAQYKSDALQLKADDPKVKMVALTSADEGLLIGLDWQNGARLFQYSGNSVTFDMNSPQANQVADYWEGLVKDGVVNTTAKFLTPSEYTAWNNGTLATQIGPAYLSGFFEQEAPDAKGDWAVAPMPQWKKGSEADGNDGGSSTAVLADTKHPYAAAVFAEWFGTYEPVLKQLYQGEVLSGADTYLNGPLVNTPIAYFGGQKILQVFKQMSEHVDTSFQWAPNQTEVTEDLTNALEGAFNGSTTISAAFASAQSQAVANLRSLGVTVNAR